MYTFGRRLRRRPAGAAFVVLAVVLSACGGTRDAPSDTLTTAGGEAAGSAGSFATDQAEIASYRLTMDKVNKYFDVATAAMRAQLKEMPATGARTEATTDTVPDVSNPTIDQMVAHTNRSPGARREIERRGFSTREYIVTGLAMFGALAAEQMLQMRPGASVESVAQEMKVHPANIRLMQQHGAEVKAKFAAFDSAAKAVLPP
jgi:hypothetical protein